MRKNVRRNMIATFGLSAVAFFAGAVSLNVNAKAAEETVEQPTQEFFVDGAGVYVGGFENGVDTTGFRFRITAKSTLIASGATIGALVLPADLTAETELKKTTVLNDGTDSQALIDEVFEAGNWVQHEKYADYKYTCVYLYNYQPADYNRDILCNAYVVDGETTTYATTLPRSMSEVALAAENDGDTRASGYIKNYNVNYFGADGVTEVDGLDEEIVRYGSLIEEPETPADTATQTFVGWYADKACKTEFDFTKPAKGTTNVYSKWEEKYVPPFATSVLINGGTVESKANFTYGDDATTATDWYYNKTTGELTKSWTATNASEFDDRMYWAEGQTGDFTFTSTVALARNAGFEFTYNDGAKIHRFFIGNFYGGLRVCIGDSQTSAMYLGMGVDDETTFKFVKTSSAMKVYINNATTSNVDTLALTIASTGITRHYGTDNNVTNQAAVATAFSAMFEKHVAIGFTVVGNTTASVTHKNISVVSEAIAPITFKTSVSLNGGTVTSPANLTYGATAATTTDWYYNKTTGELTKTFSHQTGNSDFNDRVYLAEGQTGDFTFTVTATLEHNAGFEFTYNDGAAIKRFFIGRGWGGLRICYGDASSPGVLTSGLGLSAENNETTFKFVKTSSEMKIYITNETTNNEETLAVTIASTGLTVHYGTTTATNLTSIGAAFSKMFERHIAIGFTAVGTTAPKAVYKNISIK